MGGGLGPVSCPRCRNPLIHCCRGPWAVTQVLTTAPPVEEPSGTLWPAGVLGGHSAPWGVFPPRRGCPPRTPFLSPSLVGVAVVLLPPLRAHCPCAVRGLEHPPRALRPLRPTSRPSSTCAGAAHNPPAPGAFPACADQPQGPFPPLSGTTTQGPSQPGSWYPDAAAGDDIIGGGY